MNYIEVAFTFAGPADYRRDLLIDRLGEEGYDSFLETDEGFCAYIPQEMFSSRKLNEVIEEQGPQLQLAYEVKLIPPRNWNQEWENSFQPVTIGHRCRIRASFHEPDPSFPLEILIDPRMAFGTGHHETTWLMGSLLLEAEPAGKSVLDMGCGTGILGILAAKLGAARILAVDTDPRCVESASGNSRLNGVSLECLQGDADVLPATVFDMILANINRNVLLEHLPVYAERLRPAGVLLLSGFYEGEDLDLLREKASACGLSYLESRTRNRWTAARFGK